MASGLDFQLKILHDLGIGGIDTDKRLRILADCPQPSAIKCQSQCPFTDLDVVEHEAIGRYLCYCASDRAGAPQGRINP